MLSTVLAQLNDPAGYAVPVFALFILIEVLALRFLDDENEPKGYHGVDTRTSLTMGVGSLVVGIFYKSLALLAYVAIYVYLAPWHLPANAWWTWALLIVAVDVLWYTYHRFSHRVRIGWAAHQAHHSSEYFNFGTALRQKWNPWFEGVAWMPLPFLGFPPWLIYTAFSVNLIYQFFTHTEKVGTLPKPIEFVFNTPSHHRVHHGSDPEYLDKNYAGILIIWDRMFGTFQQELHRPTYGLTTPVNTYNVFQLQYGEYGAIVRDVRRAHGLRDRLGYVFGPPGWTPSGTGSRSGSAPATASEAPA